MAAFSATGLPTGPRGRALAAAITLVGMAVIWLAIVSPLLDYYAANADALVQRRALAGRMQDLADALPGLRHQVQASQPKDAPAASLLEGATDAVAAATLQGLLETMCSSVGAKVTSSEALPAEQVGTYRRIGLRISLDANWGQLTNLLRAMEKATPRMFVDDLQLHAEPTNEKVRELPIDIALTLLAFRLPGARPALTSAATATAPRATSVDTPSSEGSSSDTPSSDAASSDPSPGQDVPPGQGQSDMPGPGNPAP